VSGTWLGVLALAVVAGAGVLWYQRLQAVRAGEVRHLVIVLMGAGALLAVAAFAAGPGWVGGLAAGIALALSGVFLALQPLSGQARTVPKVAVGGPILDFTAPDDTGTAFELASLRGKPFLLKFFRGHW
jgi:hypothetical protein